MSCLTGIEHSIRQVVLSPYMYTPHIYKQEILLGIQHHGLNIYSAICRGDRGPNSPGDGSLGLGSAEVVSKRQSGPLLDVTLPTTLDRKSTRLNSSHSGESRMPSSA